MNIAEKLTTIAENEQKIYDKGHADGVQFEYDEFWDTLQKNGKRTEYCFCFAGAGWTAKTFKPKYPIKPGSKWNDASSLFRAFNYGSPLVDFTEFNSMLDFSNITAAPDIFNNARITNLEVDLSMCGSLSTAFAMNNGGQIKNLKVKLGESNTGLSDAFYYFIEDFLVIDGSVIAVSIDLKRCSGLTLTGAKSVLVALKDFTGTDKENTYTVGLHENAWALLDTDGENSPTGTTWREYVLNKAWLT